MIDTLRIFTESHGSHRKRMGMGILRAAALSDSKSSPSRPPRSLLLFDWHVSTEVYWCLPPKSQPKNQADLAVIEADMPPVGFDNTHESSCLESS